MIDNFTIKFYSQELSEKYLKSTGNYTQSSWVWKGENDKEKETKYPLRKKVNNIELRVTEQNSVLGNSIHKYFNINMYGEEKGNHNHNDFSYCGILEALEQLKQDFKGLNLNEGYLQSLEFGFNLLVDKEPKYYLNHNFLLFEHKAPAINKATNAMNYRKFEHNNIAWKVYDKKTQYGLENNLLRVEIVLGSRELKRLGIQTLNDLKNRENILLLFSRFMEFFKGFTIVDNRFNRKDLSPEFVSDLGNRLEPSYWKNKRGKSNLVRDKMKLKEMIKQSNLNTTEIYFTELIRDKFNELFYDCDVVRQVA
ncbi:hypothetical protein IW15_03100 [Chryseobacterium soli]|uniref:Uncharacterized protein n=1 Tax=Chryseobacterium soli TaxID=445961 RepID=A0A086ACM4_9FLAO|nr:hypothetical protein [Chryseobacterium soli]KFF14438.1 hypothetical protein IW15_03100 [Chryseobacterium soli]